MDVDRSSVQGPFQAGNKLATDTPTPLLAVEYCLVCQKYVMVHANADNDYPILVGPVGCPSTGGFQVLAGEKIEIPVDSLSKVCSWTNDDVETDGFSFIGV